MLMLIDIVGIELEGGCCREDGDGDGDRIRREGRECEGRKEGGWMDERDTMRMGMRFGSRE